MFLFLKKSKPSSSSWYTKIYKYQINVCAVLLSNKVIIYHARWCTVATFPSERWDVWSLWSSISLHVALTALTFVHPWPPRDPSRQPWASLIMLLHSSSPLPSAATYCACLCFLSRWKPSKPIALVGPQVAIRRVAPTDHSKVWRPLRNYLGPEVLHYGPRALWRSWVVNHCQRHISVCLGVAHTEAFPRPFGKLLPNVDRYQSLQCCLDYSLLTHYSIRARGTVLHQHWVDGGGGRSSFYLANVNSIGRTCGRLVTVAQLERKTDTPLAPAYSLFVIFLIK